MKSIQISSKDYEEYLIIAKPIIEHPQYKQMKQYKQHANINCYEHSIDVGLRSFIFGKKHKLDYESMTRAGLLHDFFLYDWHDPNKGFHWHGYKHPRIALKHAIEMFNINKLEQEIIINHMFPLTLFHFPKSRESWAVCFIDKKCSWHELLTNKRKEISII